MDKIKCKSYLETSKFKIHISRPRGYQEPDTQVASLGCTHYSRALAPLARAQVYPKVGNCHNTCKNFKIQFSRQKFEFDFLTPKMSYFSIFLGSLNFALKQSGLNKKMPPIKLSR